MNVLSLFDGMSCGQIALDRLGIPVENYFACEIDKHAIKVSQKKWPGMVHLGSVVGVHAKDLPRIDIIIGGSPCQGFSRSGKGLNFDDPRSKLLFEFVRLYHECREINPDVQFMLENVRMKKEWEDIISRCLEIQPIFINSTFVSAQNRERLYWTNIGMKKQGLFNDNHCGIPQPKDKGIFLIDILQANVAEKYYMSDQALKRIGKLSVNSTKPIIGVVNDRGKLRIVEDKSQCLVANYFKGMDNHGMRTMIFEQGANPVICHNMMPRSSKTGKGGTGHLFRTDGKSYCLDTGQTNAIEYQESGKPRLRRLTPIECCRLQTVPDNYFFDNTCGGGQICSDSQIYKMCGNGWTVDVICHILSFAKFNSKP